VSPSIHGVAQPSASTTVERLALRVRLRARGIRGRLRLRGEGGFTLIESVLAMMLFAIVSTALTGLLTSSISAQKVSHEKTLAEQTVSSQIEWIRQQPYDNVGTPGGNPSGTINATGLKNGSNPVVMVGLRGNLFTKIQYVDDPTPNSYQTKANYKMVTVTLLRASDNILLARQVTYIAPPGQAPYGGINLAIINAQVMDMGNNTPLSAVQVNLATGPSAPRSDSTDATGTVTFPALTANPTSGSQAYYDLSVTPPTGYTALSDDVSPSSAAHVQLSPGQTFNTVLRVYQGCTIFVQLTNASDGSAYTGNANVTVSSSRGSQTFSYTGSPLTITQIAGENVVPGLSYTVMTANGFYSTSTSKTVPNNYPSDLTSTFAVSGYATGSVTSTVTWGGAAVSGATVTLTGGPVSLSQTQTTNASGQVTFTDVPAGSGYTVTATKSGQSVNASATVTQGATTSVPLALPTGTIVSTVTWAGANVNGATVTLTGGPMSVNVSGTTNASGQVTFVSVPAGSGYTVTASKGGQSVNASATVSGGATTNVSLALPTGTVVVTVNWGGSPVNGASVTLSGGNLGAPVSGTTNSSGQVTFTSVPAGTGYSVSATSGGQTGTASGVTVTGGSTTNVTVPMPTGTVAVTVTWGGAAVNGATVTISGGNLGSPVTGSTNASGQITFSSVPAGSGYTVTATKSGQSASNSAVTVTGGSSTNVSLALPTGTLVVTVTSGGSPVNGATIAVTGGPMPISPLTTNSSGVATFTNVPVFSGYTVTATSGLQNASQTGVNVTNGATTNVSLSFPVGNVQVNVTWAGVAVANCVNCVTISGGNLASPVTGSTDASGNVTFVNVPAGTGYTVTATKSGQSANQTGVTVTGGSTTSVTIQLPVGTVAVNVKWGGVNVANCVNCVTISGGNLSASVTGSTDASGNVTFVNVPAGTGYTVTATKSGQSASNNAVTVTGGSTTNVNLTLPTGTFVVTVNQPSGTAAANATVTLTLGPMNVNVSGTTNASGQVTFSNVPTGTGYTVAASRYGQSASLTNQTETTGTVNLTINLAAYSQGSIQIIVHNSTGSNCTSLAYNWTISGGPYSYSASGSATTNSSGVLGTFSGVPAGSPYTVTVTRTTNAGRTGTTSSVVVTSGSTTSVTVTLNGSSVCS
jgi:type II secretory pathway pseudopilin PulG